MSLKSALSILTIIVCIYICLITMVLILVRGQTHDVSFSWQSIFSSNSTSNSIEVCDGDFSIKLIASLRITLQVITILFEVFFGYLLYYKLKCLISFLVQDANIANNSIYQQIGPLHKIMKRQTLLVTISTLSTMVLWTISNIYYWSSGIDTQMFIYLDMLINNICMTFMFKFYERYYNRYCKYCIQITDFCIPSFSLSQNNRYQQIPDENNRAPQMHVDIPVA